MTEEKQNSKKEPLSKELSDNQVVMLHSILNSGIQIPARTAVHLVGLQEWVNQLVKERKIPVKK